MEWTTIDCDILNKIIIRVDIFTMRIPTREKNLLRGGWCNDNRPKPIKEKEKWRAALGSTNHSHRYRNTTFPFPATDNIASRPDGRTYLFFASGQVFLKDSKFSPIPAVCLLSTETRTTKLQLLDHPRIIRMYK